MKCWVISENRRSPFEFEFQIQTRSVEASVVLRTNQSTDPQNQSEI